MHKMFKTMITKSYCPDWTKGNAIREWVANALDSPAPFHYSYDPIEEHLFITSKDTELPAKCLALGMSTKRDEEESVGVHGEGLLVALGVALREGLSVLIRNGSKQWEPYYEWDNNIEEEVLVIEETQLLDNSDLTFIVGNVDEELMNEVSDNCLYLAGDLGEVIETEMGRIFKDIPGKLFVGGIFVTKTSQTYTYDFKPKYLKLNRDRKAVDTWDLTVATAKMWAMADRPSEVAVLLEKGLTDVDKLQYGFTNVTPEIREACYSVYKEQYEGKFLAGSYAEEEELREKGVKDVIYIGKTAFTDIVRSHSSYEEPIVDEEEPEEDPLVLLQDAIDLTVCNLIDKGYDEDCLDSLNDLLDKFKSKGVRWDD